MRFTTVSALLAGLLFAPAFSSSALADTARSSASYGIQFDALAAGSGASSSASYSQPQCLVGQDVIWNNYDSASYDFQPVGTFLFPTGASAVRNWLGY